MRTQTTIRLILPAALFLLAAWPAQAEQYHGNGDTGFGGAIGNGTLTLSDDGTNISGTLTVGGSMDDVLVLYIQTGPGGFTNTSGFNDQGDACRRAISGVSASGRSLLTFAGGFQPNYAIALAPAAAGTGGQWQLANGGNNSLTYMGSVNLAPLNNTGPYTFSLPAALIGMIPGVRSAIQFCGTYVRTDGSRSTEAIAGNLTGTQGWNPFTQAAYASYTFDAGAVLVKLGLGIWAQGPSGVPPTARARHTAVWTGSEMIVWGGVDGSRYLNDGGRFNPVANSWRALPTIGAPAARDWQTAVWTGSEMIVWGGWNTASYLTDGGRYNPVADNWTALPANGAPVGRARSAAVWTGSEMVVWGGYNGGSYLNDGGRYNPSDNSWTALPTAGAPAARDNHTAVWTGSEMIVWGGECSLYSYCFNDGGRYNPVGNTWTALPTNNAPSARYLHTAVWADSEMIIWGGGSSGSQHYLNDGGRYNPTVNAWTGLTTTGAPAARDNHTAVWTGSEMLIWGGVGYSDTGFLNDGGRYNPVANSWTPQPTKGAPVARSAHTVVWTGNEMIVWGGAGTNYSNDGGRYHPAADIWRPLPAETAPATRSLHTAVWTGSEMLVWGGRAGTYTFFNDGGRYNPAANTWTALPVTGAPFSRYRHTAVWTGREMIIWGGYNNINYYADGGRYDAVANMWTPLPTTNAPAPRCNHTAVWAGSEMIVWGGYSNETHYADGGRYNPAANRWTAVTTNGAPTARNGHTAVWTGSEMIIWGGGTTATLCNDGGRFDTTANSWTPTATLGAPTARIAHTAVWTGSEMIVWGGHYFSVGTPGFQYLNNGARYDRTADSWTAVTISGAPAARDFHTAVWTGSEMLVWGGWNGSSNFNDGGRYIPAANSWTAVPPGGAPVARNGHTAVWTGTEMVIFGGYGTGGYRNDTWSYSPYAPAVRISQSGPSSAEVAWPVWHPTLRLCQTTNLAEGPWTTVTNDVTQVGAENRVTVSPLSGSQFFRAQYP